MFDESLLREQADRCVRLVALSLLADAQKAGDRLMRVSQELRDADAGSDDALHDFRVAVRRLRSWTGAFKPLLRGAVSRKQRRGLSGMRAASDFDGMATKLTRRLNVHRSAVLTRERPSRFGAILAERLLKESESLRGHLAAIHHATDVEESHRARIAAKRLRYVVEPVSELDGDGRAIVETLKTLQDSLGDLHDVHVFSEEVVPAAGEAAARPGLIRLARRLRERGARAYAGIAREWLNDAGTSFFDRVRALAADITRRASAGTEIELKYLLERLPDEALDAPSVEIEQGYLPGETLVERIRHVRSPAGTER